MKTYWVSCSKMTVMVEVDNKGRVVDAAPVVRRFIGQPFRNLTLWFKKLGGLRCKQI